MADSWVRAVITYERDTGIPADRQTNTLYFSSSVGTAATVAADADANLALFVQAFDLYMPSQLFVPTATTAYYDMTDAEPRVPILESTIAMTNSAVAGLPTECTACVSFQGPIVSGVNQARRRGRLYLPTFDTGTIEHSVGRIRWKPAVTAALATACEDLMTNSGTDGMAWSVYSPTVFAETGNLGTAFTPITNGWVDDAPDTQRRRGHVALLRQLWS